MCFKCLHATEIISNTNYFVDVTVYHNPGFLCDIFLVELVITFISLPIIEVFVAFGSELKFSPFFKWCGVQHWHFTVAE